MASMPAEPWSVSLLGPPRIRSSERAIGFRPDLRYRLLAYLAHSTALEGGVDGGDTEGDDGGWVTRERIAFLFWPDSEDGTARKRLSQLLKRLARLPWLDGLERDSHRVRWRVPSDVAAFRSALGRRDTDRALALYRGPFLAGFDVGSNAEYGSWLEHERGELHGLWRDAVLQSSEARERGGDPAAAADMLQQLMNVDPLDEIALQRHLLALAASGRAGAALRRFQAFAETLRDELGIEPSLQSREIARRIEAEAAAPLPLPPISAALPDEDLPLAVTPFVGRDLELAALSLHLGQPESRLITLVGPAGVGKSRLAVQAVRERPAAAPERIAFAALDAALTGDEMLAAVARAFGVAAGGDADAILGRIGDALGAERRLLLLDNVEQISGVGPALAKLLGRCPGLVCLATSRERLGLRAERLVRLRGLAYPDEDLPLADAMRFDAIELFVQHARRVRPDYRTSPADLVHLNDLCRALEGLPLALELAANWLRATDLPELAEAIRDDTPRASGDDRGFDLLASNAPDAPDRHRSMRAAFEHSWRLLVPAERRALRLLAVFHDGFRREGAEQVAGASLPLLTALVDKSLLRAAPGGRYDRHPLLYRFSAEKLAAEPAERSAAEERHARYYFDLLLRRATALTASPAEQRTALEAVEAEWQNLRAAWRAALARGWAHHVTAAVEPLERFLQRSGRVDLLRELFAEGAAAFEDRPGGRVVHALLLAKQGWYAQRAGDLDAAVELSERSLALLRGYGPSSGAAQALNTLGFVAQQRQDYRVGARWMRRALAVAHDIGNPWYIAGFGNNLAILEGRLGNHEVAEGLFAETLELNRRSGDVAEVVINLLNFAELALGRGDPDRAAEMLAEGLDLARKIGFRDIEPFYVAAWSLVELERGDADRARALCLEALELLAPLPDRPEVAARLVELGRIELRRDDASAAVEAFAKALALSQRLDYQPGMHLALAGVAEARLAQGRSADAAPLLKLLTGQADLDADVRQHVDAMLGRVRSVDPAAAPRGTFETIVAELLVRLPSEPGEARPRERFGDEPQ